MTSPTTLTLRHLRRRGFSADVAERFIARANIRRDLFGCIDVVAVKAGGPILGVQATTIGHVAHRLAKARRVAELHTWLAAGARFQVWGWVKRRGLWVPKIVEVQALDVPDVVLQIPPRKRRRSAWQPADLFAPGADTDNCPDATGGKHDGRSG